MFPDEIRFFLSDGIDGSKIKKLEDASSDLLQAAQTALAAAIPHNDPTLVGEILSGGRFANKAFIEAGRQFQAWEFESKERIAKFRASLTE
jgi:hypothetical protein